jgi:hypothetical protein
MKPRTAHTHLPLPCVSPHTHTLLHLWGSQAHPDTSRHSTPWLPCRECCASATPSAVATAGGDTLRPPPTEMKPDSSHPPAAWAAVQGTPVLEHHTRLHYTKHLVLVLLRTLIVHTTPAEPSAPCSNMPVTVTAAAAAAAAALSRRPGRHLLLLPPLLWHPHARKPPAKPAPLLHPLLLLLLLACLAPALQATLSQAGPAQSRCRPALLHPLGWLQAGAGTLLLQPGKAQARQNSSRLLLLLVTAQVLPHCASLCRKQEAGSLHRTTADTVAAGCRVRRLLLSRCRQCGALSQLSAWVCCTLVCRLPARGPGTLQLLHCRLCPVAGKTEHTAQAGVERRQGTDQLTHRAGRQLLCWDQVVEQTVKGTHANTTRHLCAGRDAHSPSQATS